MSDQPAAPARGSTAIDVAVTAGLLIVGVYFFVTGTFQYGVWVNRGPGPGFFGTVFGALLVCCTAAHLRARSRWLAARIEPISLLPLAALVVSVLLVPLLGMAETLALFVTLWIGIVDRRPVLLTLLIGAATFLAIEIGFGRWLGVFLPDGLLSPFFRF